MIKNIWNTAPQAPKSSAAIVDGNLILSLPDAMTPAVWKMELGSVKSSALEVRKTPDNTYMLLLKSTKGDMHDIAPFETRETALQALMCVSDALKGARGKMAPLANQNEPSNKPEQSEHHGTAGEMTSFKWVATLAGILLVIFLFAYLSKSGPMVNTQIQNEGTVIPSSNAGQASGAAAESGTPQSADELLKGF